MIPKIIHQTAPTKVEEWHSIWFDCQESWFKHHPASDFHYIMWTDERIDELVRNQFPELFDMYIDLPIHILKIDFVRFLILYVHGGIYADMDMYCYKNFHDELTKDCYLVGSRMDEFVQNSLMASVPKSKFIKFCIDECVKRIKTYDMVDVTTPKVGVNPCDNEDLPFDTIKIREIAGPLFLGDTYNAYPNKDEVGILDWKKYNPWIQEYNDELRTKHMYTGAWGRETIDRAKNLWIQKLAKGETTAKDVIDQHRIDYVDWRNFPADFKYNKQY